MHRITVDREPNATVVTASGELDAYVAPDLADAFGSVPADTGLAVDLVAVSFLDSTALGLIVKAVREVARRGREVRVVLPQGSARRIFEITTLDRVLPVAESRERALAELHGR
jgi:anti-sigma B factor antagonist